MTSVWKVNKALRGYNPLTANVRALLQWVEVIIGVPRDKLDLTDWVDTEKGTGDPLWWLALTPWFQREGWSVHFNEKGEGYPQLEGRSPSEHPGRSLAVYLFPGLVGLGLEVPPFIQRILLEEAYPEGLGVPPALVVRRINELLAAVLLDAYSANCRSEG